MRRDLHRVENITVVHQGRPCGVELGRYGNGRTAVCLYDRETNEPHATATINLPDESIAPDEVFIKDYSENAGMLAALETAGLVAPTGREVRTGYVSAPVVKLLVPVPSPE